MVHNRVTPCADHHINPSVRSVPLSTRPLDAYSNAFGSSETHQTTRAHGTDQVLPATEHRRMCLRRLTSESRACCTPQPLSPSAPQPPVARLQWRLARDRKPPPIAFDREPEIRQISLGRPAARLHCIHLCRPPTSPTPRTLPEAFAFAHAKHCPCSSVAERTTACFVKLKQEPGKYKKCHSSPLSCLVIAHHQS